MGNSLLDIIVYGRISGRSAAQYASSQAQDGKLHLDHVVQYNAEIDAAGVGNGRVAPMIIPDYTDPEVRERQLTTHYVGTVR
jgi:succinate dehydrogenase/fumarate reductase flavoprotein subunit